ncbi:hypothetical protein [Streptomyces sp. NPDC056921]
MGIRQGPAGRAEDLADAQLLERPGRYDQEGVLVDIVGVRCA